MRIDTTLGPEVLLLDSFQGVEEVSSPYSFQLDLLSEKADIDAPSMLRQPVVLTFALPDGETRHLHGLIRRFVQLGQRDELTAYRVDVVPWLWFLSLSRDCRIFQNLSVPEIVETVFRDLGFSDFEMRCNATHPKRNYCVQYRETHLDFVSRLLEDEGIHYFFEHTDEKHTLVIADNSTAANASPVATARFHRQRIQNEDIVWTLEREHAVHSGAVTLRDYDYLQPALTLENALAGDGPEQIFDYPGKYATLDEGDRYVRLRLETQEARWQTLRGESSCRGLAPGHSLELRAHYRPDTNGPYLILQVRHFMKGGEYRAWAEASAVEYHNEFLAIPLDTPYRPPLRTARPVVHGTQAAVVTGPAGEEVHVDKHGRVKIQFYWDRRGRRDEKSSCWVRVASPWAGKGYGGVSIPRIGNEVVVEFMEGDPDRPIIVSCVFNADQTVPFSLPGAGIQMGMKSRSSPGGGGYNEITMTDTKGKEAMTVHAQYDRSSTIGHDDSISVKNDRSVSVTGKCSHSTKADHSLTVTDGNYSHSVVKGKAGFSVKQDVTLSSVSGAIGQTANKDFTITSSTAAISLTASTKISIKVGGSSIEMDSGGKITIKGKSIMIDGSDDVTVQGSKIQVTAKAEAKVGVGSNQVTCSTSQVNVSGAAIAASAVGMHTIAGAVVKIN